MLGDPPGTEYFEIPLVIQDRSFTDSGDLFYPASRAFFEGLDPSELQIPFMPDPACGGPSDIAPIWNPEFFGNTMLVNGATWPSLEVQQRRYRFRLLNGCNARFLILRISNGLPIWQIGNEGGFLPAPVELREVLFGPAERADVIVDFTGVAAGSEIILQNVGPDEPFGGGIPGVDFEPADPDTTGQVMRFTVIASKAPDPSTSPDKLVFPAIAPLGPPTSTSAALPQRAGVSDGAGERPRTARSSSIARTASPSGPPRRNWERSSPTAPAYLLAGTTRSRRRPR